MLGLGILAAALALKRVSDEIAYRATTDERRLQLHVSRAGRDDLTKREPAPQPLALRLHLTFGYLMISGPWTLPGPLQDVASPVHCSADRYKP